jgi:hypothetical protein
MALDFGYFLQQGIANDLPKQPKDAKMPNN